MLQNAQHAYLLERTIARNIDTMPFETKFVSALFNVIVCQGDYLFQALNNTKIKSTMSRSR